MVTVLLLLIWSHGNQFRLFLLRSCVLVDGFLRWRAMQFDNALI
jgi:hypothetical protein